MELLFEEMQISSKLDHYCKAKVRFGISDLDYGGVSAIVPPILSEEIFV